MKGFKFIIILSLIINILFAQTEADNSCVDNDIGSYAYYTLDKTHYGVDNINHDNEFVNEKEDDITIDNIAVGTFSDTDKKKVITHMLFHPTHGNYIENDERIPLIVIHGLAPKEDNPLFKANKDNLCESVKNQKHYVIDRADSYFSVMNGYLSKKYITDKYRIYYYSYPTYKHISFNGRMLSNLLYEDKYIQQWIKKGNKLTFLAHSMGGLVTRSMLEEHKGIWYPEDGIWKNIPTDNFLGALITLATPHHGSPSSIPDWFDAGKLGDKMGWPSPDRTLPGTQDLFWDNYDGILFHSTLLNEISTYGASVFGDFREYENYNCNDIQITEYDSIDEINIYDILKDKEMKSFDNNFSSRLSLTNNENCVRKQKSGDEYGVQETSYDYKKIKIPSPNPWLSYLNSILDTKNDNYKSKYYFYGGYNDTKGDDEKSNIVNDDSIEHSALTDMIYNAGYFSDYIVPTSSSIYDTSYKMETPTSGKLFTDFANGGKVSGPIWLWNFINQHSDYFLIKNDIAPKIRFFKDYDHSRMMAGSYHSHTHDMFVGNEYGITDDTKRRAYIQQAYGDSPNRIPATVEAYEQIKPYKIDYDPLYIRLTEDLNSIYQNIKPIENSSLNKISKSLVQKSQYEDVIAIDADSDTLSDSDEFKNYGSLIKDSSDINDAPTFINTLTQNCSAPKWASNAIYRKDRATCLDSWNYFSYNKENRHVITPNIRRYQRTISTIDEAYTDANKVIDTMHNQLSNIVAMVDIKGMAKKYAWKKALNPTFGVDQLEDIPIIKDMIESNEMFESLSEEDKTKMAKKIRDIILSQIEAKVGELPASTKQAVKILDLSADIMQGKIDIGAKDIVNAMRDVATTAVALRGAYDTITAHKKMREPIVVQYYLEEYYKQLSNSLITNNFFNGSDSRVKALQYISENNVLPYHSLAVYDGFDFDGYDIDVNAVSGYIDTAKLSIKQRAKVKLKQDSFATIDMTMKNRFTPTGTGSSFELNITNSGYWDYKDINLTVLFPADKIRLDNWDSVKQAIETEVRSNGLAVGETISKKVNFTALASTYDDITISADVTLNSVESAKTTSYQSAKLYFDTEESALFIENDLAYRMVKKEYGGKQYALVSDLGSIKIHNTTDKPITIMNMTINDDWLKIGREPKSAYKGINFWIVNGEIKNEQTAGRYGDSLVIPPYGYMINGKSQSFLDKSVEQVEGDYLSKKLEVLVKKEDGTTKWIEPHFDPILLHVEEYNAYEFLQGSEDIKIVLEQGTGVKNHTIPIQIEQQLIKNGILDNETGWNAKWEGNHNGLELSKERGHYFTSELKLVDGKWKYFGENIATVDFNITLDPSSKDLPVGVYDSTIVVDIGHGIKGILLDGSYRETVRINVALHVIPKPTPNSGETPTDDYKEYSDKKPNELNITLPTGATYDESTQQITAAKDSTINIKFDDSFANEYAHGFTELAYRIKGSERVYRVHVQNSGDGEIAFEMPYGATIEILYVEDSLGNRYDLGDVGQVVGRGDSGNSPTCSDKVTDIACEVGVHIADSLLLDVNHITISDNYAYVTTSENKLKIVDISNPLKIVEVNSTNIDSGNLKIQGNYLLNQVSEFDKKIQIFDISNPLNPVKKGVINSNSRDTVRAIEIVGNYAYVGYERNRNLEIFDISNTDSPIHKKTFRSFGNLGDGIYDIKIMIDKAFIVSRRYDNGQRKYIFYFTVLDILNPIEPTIEDSLILDSFADKLLIKDNYAYLSNGTILNISQMTREGSVSIPSQYRDNIANIWNYMVMDDKNLYIVINSNTIRVIDISNRKKPQEKGLFYLDEGLAKELIKKGQYLFVATGEGGIQVVDISNIENLAPIPQIKSDEIITEVVGVSEKFAYIKTSYGYDVIDISDKTHTTLVKKITVANYNNKHTAFLDKECFYTISRSYLSIYNANNPTELLSKIDINFGANHDSIVIKNKKFLYVLSKNSNLTIIDVSNPSSPTFSQIELDISVSSYNQKFKMMIKNNSLYIGNYKKIIVFDISTPLAIKKINSFEHTGIVNTNRDSYAIEFKDNYAYFLAKTKVYVVDISNRLDIKQIDEIEFNTSGETGYVFVGDYIYNYNRELLNISNPLNLKVIDSIDDSDAKLGFSRGDTMIVKNNYLYVFGGIYRNGSLYKEETKYRDKGLTIVDISNPLNPIFQGHLGSYEPKDIKVVGDYAYIADGFSGLKIIDISNKTEPKFTNSLNIDYAEKFDILNDYAYVLSDNRIKILDISNPLNIQYKKIFTPNIDKATRSDYKTKNLLINNDFCYITNFYKMQSLDMSNPLNLVQRGETSTNISQYYSSLYLDENEVYFGEADKNYLYDKYDVVDISNRSNLISKGTKQFTPEYTVGSYYFTNVDNSFTSIDISNPDIAVEKDSLVIDKGIYSIKIKDGYAYVVGEKQITIIDISNPLALKEVSKIQTKGKLASPYQLEFSDNYLFFSSSDAIEIINIVDLINPKFLSLIHSDYDMGYFKVRNNYLYSLTGDYGLKAFDWKKVIERKQVIDDYYINNSSISMLTLESETPNDNAIKNETYQKSWTFSLDISAYTIDILNSSFSSYTNLSKNGNTVTIELTPDNTKAINEIKLQFKDSSGNVVKVGNSPTFWAISKTNHAPRLADGQVTQVTSGIDETARLNIATYDADGDSVTLSVIESDGGSVSFVGNELVASFSDTQTIHHVTIRLDDGKEQVNKSIVVLRFDANSIDNFYSDIGTSTYKKDILFATLSGVVWGEPNPSNLQERVFRPNDNASWAEVLKMIVNAGAIANKIELPNEGSYLQTEPSWATPYYSFARAIGAIENQEGIDLSRVYPTREEIAKLLVKVFKLDEKIRDLTIDNNPFKDETKFSREKMFNYGKMVNFFGLFMTGDYAIADAKISRGAVARIINKIFMIPTATIKNPASVEYGNNFSMELIDKVAKKVSEEYKLVDSSSELTASFIINNTMVEPIDINSSTLHIGSNRILSLIDNHGVRELLFSTIVVNYSDADSDGVQDSQDTWVDDYRYSQDINGNGIPDEIDEFYGIGDKNVNDSIIIGGESVTIVDLIADGRHLGGEFYVEDNNTPPIANAGVDQTITEGTVVTLDGSTSSDSDGNIVSYAWKEGDTVLSTQRSFTKSDFVMGEHHIILTIIDDDGATDSDEVIIVVGKNIGHPFITTWKTDNEGSSEDNQITIPTYGGGYNYSVDWGDGKSDSGVTGSITHTYDSVGTYTVKISGEFHRIKFNENGDNKKILSIKQWGDIEWQSMYGAFYDCSNLVGEAVDKPNLSNVTTMTAMFSGASSFNQNIGDWNTSTITRMDQLFENATSFNQNIAKWDTSKVNSMVYMFSGASSFNQDIGDWNTSNVEAMYSMFYNATQFNQPIGKWDVSKVNHMSYMFSRATSFNIDLSSWDVANVENMYALFLDASSFDQDIGDWNISKVMNIDKIFSGVTLSRENYDAILRKWSQLTLQNNLIFNAGNSVYSSTVYENRQKIIDNYNWTIIDRGVEDTDNDGIPNDIEIALDLNPNSNDSDGDGYLDSEEIGDVNSPLDTDNDGIINALDTDSDGDGVSDKEEREQGTDYLDNGDKPEALGITLAKTSYKLGLGLRDINLSIGVIGGYVKVTIINNEQDIFTTTKQWSGEWIDTNDYEDEGLTLTLKALKAESGLISIEVENRAGESIKEDIFIEVINIADFVENQSTPAHLEDVNQSCIDMGARLPTYTEINDVYMVVDNYLTTVDALWTSTPHPTQSGHLEFTGRDSTYPWVNAAFDTASTHCVKEDKPIIVNKKLVFNPGYNLVHISGTIEELVSKFGYLNLISIQGGGQGTAYKKSNVENDKEFLNTLKKIEDGKAYWVNVLNRVEIEMPRVAYRGRKVISLKAGWNLIDPYGSLSIAQIVEQITFNKLEVIQGAKQGTSYKRINVENGKPHLNTLQKFESPYGYWIKVTEDCELSFFFDLDIDAKDILSNPINRVESINGVNYTIKLFTNTQPQTETSQGSVSVYGDIDGEQVIIEINDSYTSTAKFQVAIYDSDGNEVGRSEIVDFAEDSIDFGSFVIEG